MKQQCNVLLFIMMFSPASLYGASFDCAKAHLEVEKMICMSSALSSLDTSLSAVYSDKLNASGAAPKTMLKKSQKEWLTIRNRCSSEACVENAYIQRLSQLEAWRIGYGTPLDAAFLYNVLQEKPAVVPNGINILYQDYEHTPSIVLFTIERFLNGRCGNGACGCATRSDLVYLQIDRFNHSIVKQQTATISDSCTQPFPDMDSTYIMQSGLEIILGFSSGDTASGIRTLPVAVFNRVKQWDGFTILDYSKNYALIKDKMGRPD